MRDFPPAEPRPGVDIPDKVPTPDNDNMPLDIISDPRKLDKYLEEQKKIDERKRKKSEGESLNA